jgi:hypothetical protein
MVVIRTKDTYFHSWPECVDEFIRVVKQMNQMHIVPIGAIAGLAHVVQHNVASDGINSVRLV